uniref:Uncharacterized protein n=1 Tax=Fibrocapsa japonica TaxID=94617 RepID=A0A7S2V8A7_9STRA
MGSPTFSVLIPVCVVGIFSIMLIIFFGIRRCNKCKRRSQVPYNAVAHELDDDELLFKKTLEMKGDDVIDKLFDFDGQDDMEFDAKDLDNLESLESYRKNLVASALEDHDETDGV